MKHIKIYKKFSLLEEGGYYDDFSGSEGWVMVNTYPYPDKPTEFSAGDSVVQNDDVNFVTGYSKTKRVCEIIHIFKNEKTNEYVITIRIPSDNGGTSIGKVKPDEIEKV